MHKKSKKKGQAALEVIIILGVIIIGVIIFGSVYVQTIGKQTASEVDSNPNNPNQPNTENYDKSIYNDELNSTNTKPSGGTTSGGDGGSGNGNGNDDTNPGNTCDNITSTSQCTVEHCGICPMLCANAPACLAQPQYSIQILSPKLPNNLVYEFGGAHVMLYGVAKIYDTSGNEVNSNVYDDFTFDWYITNDLDVDGTSYVSENPAVLVGSMSYGDIYLVVKATNEEIIIKDNVPLKHRGTPILPLFGDNENDTNDSVITPSFEKEFSSLDSDITFDALQNISISLYGTELNGEVISCNWYYKNITQGTSGLFATSTDSCRNTVSDLEDIFGTGDIIIYVQKVRAIRYSETYPSIVWFGQEGLSRLFGLAQLLGIDPNDKYENNQLIGTITDTRMTKIKVVH